MLSAEELAKMQHMDIMELEREELVDIEDIEIDAAQSVEERWDSFIRQAKNPFAYKVGKYILQVGFQEDTEERIEDRMVLLVERNAQTTI